MKRARVVTSALLVAIAATGNAAARDEAEPDADACLEAFEKGQSLRAEGALLKAREQLARCAESGCFDVVRAKCDGWRDEIERDIPTLWIRVRDRYQRPIPLTRSPSYTGEVAQVTLDGRALLTDEIEVDPGQHVLTARAYGMDVKTTTTVTQGQKREQVMLVIPFPDVAQLGEQEKQTKRDRLLTASYAIAGVAVAGFVIFGALAAVGRSKEAELRDMGCARYCDVSEPKGLYLGADIALAVGIASTLTAVTLFSVGMSVDVNGEGANGTSLHLGPTGGWLVSRF